jgi:hypothetical protein
MAMTDSAGRGGSVATLRVRYRTGDTDEWDLNEQMKLEGLGEALHETALNKGDVSFGFQTRTGHEGIDYGMAFVHMADVVMWELDGFFDESRLIETWGPEQS